MFGQWEARSLHHLETAQPVRWEAANQLPANLLLNYVCFRSCVLLQPHHIMRNTLATTLELPSNRITTPRTPQHPPVLSVWSDRGFGVRMSFRLTGRTFKRSDLDSVSMCSFCQTGSRKSVSERSVSVSVCVNQQFHVHSVSVVLKIFLIDVLGATFTEKSWMLFKVLTLCVCVCVCVDRCCNGWRSSFPQKVTKGRRQNLLTAGTLIKCYQCLL